MQYIFTEKKYSDASQKLRGLEDTQEGNLSTQVCLILNPSRAGTESD